MTFRIDLAPGPEHRHSEFLDDRCGRSDRHHVDALPSGIG